MLVVIIIYDQLLFRPLVTFGSRFRIELSSSEEPERSWVLQLFRRTSWLRAVSAVPAQLFNTMALWRLELPFRSGPSGGAPSPVKERLLDAIWTLASACAALWGLWLIFRFVSETLTLADLGQAVKLTCFTMVRVIAMMALASIIWVPIGVKIGLNPRLAEKIQPLAQFLAAFPANVLFPIAVVLILHFALNPDIWLSFLIAFGTQWYILFNVIGGASAFPNDLKEAAGSFRVGGLEWWTKVMLPGIFPAYVTGALTASGGSWNAAIVAEYVKWGNDTVAAHGIGAYIAQATAAGDFPRIVLGVAVMSVFVIFFNRLLWRPLARLAERRFRLQ
jgi:NitT/TauT family transport system permease protein